ncbi:PREDICTED: probable LRR receptor-like serine/threonine-protein kinase At1g34110 [Theobroma cacao]|uniref:Probable LRR receptor-like serine/threonine-protein kinase At1g34110 n=1 Tax=Theobroma cacao TaxID=3641 RepID=A0AB32WFL0_THECC|nr:PREDICTED: probable LRR receptor-like serine/threonine-protein kinase At1g34110 [Theobroma cacao]
MKKSGNHLLKLNFVQLFLCFLCFGNANDLNIGCSDIEKKALLDFKESLTDPFGRLSSWVGEDCCQWHGVSCKSETGQVTKLNLRNSLQTNKAAQKKSALRGKINSSLLNLKNLRYLDLSMNNFEGSPIPQLIGSLRTLSYLNLSYAQLGGSIPPHLGNLSNLQYLDLHSYSDSSSKLIATDLLWLRGLPSLEYLDMGGVDLSAVTDWLQQVNMLPSLSELYLSSCKLLTFPFFLPFVNFTSLVAVDMSNNLFNSPMPGWIFNITGLKSIFLSSNNLIGTIPRAFANMHSLQHLDLSHQFLEGTVPGILGNLSNLKSLTLAFNNLSGNLIEFTDGLSKNNSLEVLDLTQNRFSGHLPDALGNLTNLRSLVLRENMFWGSIPESIRLFSSLQHLSLFGNPMNGSIPESIGQLSQLVVLDFGQTAWRGTISEQHFSNLTKLEKLEISSTSRKKALTFSWGSQWTPPFNLKSIIIAHNKVGPSFPEWIKTQSNLATLFLNDVEISGKLPDWFWSWCSQRIDDLDLANNNISGTLPRSLQFHYETNVYLISNHLEGPIPLWSNVRRLYLWSNSFSGPIPDNISETMPMLRDLDLSRNFLTGGIPSSIVKLKDLISLVLSDNNLSGELPQDWSQVQRLQVLDLANNSLSGEIPGSMGALHSLRLLILSSNSFVGEIPFSLQNCRGLWSFDLGKNKFSGKVPTWIGDSTPLLMILSLRSNLFTGNIPRHLCHLRSLHVMDLADNNLSGVIPTCLGNLTGMASEVLFEDAKRYEGNVMIVAKGREIEYSSTLPLVKIIDLSANNLTGKVPEEIIKLHRLGTLNLSNNHLTGSIPSNIGNLYLLETLDFSRNQLSGSIPPSLSSISSLNHLNLSYNDLVGKIPSGNQLQTLNDPSIYKGNPGLCGVPLTNKCEDGRMSSDPHGDGDDTGENNVIEMKWFYIGILVGFLLGFWGVCGTLLLKKSWRLAYFQFIDEGKEKASMFIAVSLARWQRKLDSSRSRM